MLTPCYECIPQLQKPKPFEIALGVDLDLMTYTCCRKSNDIISVSGMSKICFRVILCSSGSVCADAMDVGPLLDLLQEVLIVEGSVTITYLARENSRFNGSSYTSPCHDLNRGYEPVYPG
jgi:hypothetical protein